MDANDPRREDELSALEQRLANWQPASESLSADAMLYAAGRDSARANRPWIALAVALAVTQAATLTLWWSQPTPPVAQTPAPAAAPPVTPPPLDYPTSSPSDDPGLWSAYQGLRAPEITERPEPPPSGRFVDSGPPLRAFRLAASSILN